MVPPDVVVLQLPKPYYRSRSCMPAGLLDSGAHGTEVKLARARDVAPSSLLELLPMWFLSCMSACMMQFHTYGTSLGWQGLLIAENASYLAASQWSYGSRDGAAACSLWWYCV